MPKATDPADVFFEEWDFAALEPDRSTSREYDERRLATRRKLGDLAKALVARLAEGGLVLDPRTSLHNPHAFNGNRVRRLWAYLVRPKKEKARLRKVLGAELAKDLDAAYRNAYLCLAVEADALEVSLRIHADAWYDGQNLKKRVARDGERRLLELLNALSGFRLRLDDWKGEWTCGSLEPERLREFLGYWTPGEHALAVEARWPAPPGARGPVLGEGVASAMVEAASGLADLYRYAAWSEESDFLFG